VGERLDSWKDIAAYLGREVRTVQRWALARSLPVHRLPGGGSRPRVFSHKSEIDAWMRAGPLTTSQPLDDVASVAVLPFLNLAGAVEDQYFGDGLADDVINALVRVPGLRVTARTSSFAFTERGRDVRQIGAKLGVNWLIEGSVRRDRDRIRVSAQLINVGTAYHAWSECYDRQLTDVFAIQDEIARSIALALRIELALGPPSERPTDDMGAYDLWMQGRSISQRFTPAAMAKARECYEAAIARDPHFARPYFGLAELLFYGVQFGLTTSPDDARRARDAIATSLKLDDRFGEAHALSGVLLGLLDYDWAGAEAAFHRALELSPGSATVLIQHAWYHLVPRLQIARALEEARQAVALDPLAPFPRGLYGLVLLVARQYGRAAAECREAVRLAPGLWWLHWFYASALLMQGKVVQGFQHARKVYDEIHQPLVVGGMAMLYGLFLRRGKARQMLEELREMSPTAYVPPVAFAWGYLGLGDDRVFEWLDKAIDARDPVVTHLPSMPLYDGIRDDPRFRALLARMHLE
jgi:TolB-like protein/tetratricopeptide (TPR) repeat protein